MKKQIAIIGSGITGLGAAYALQDTADVTVFEAADRPGGHAHTVQLDYSGVTIPVDVGFIVYNGLNYPNLIGLFEALDVETEASDMSFAVSNPQGFEWASTLNGLFAQRRNILRPRFHRFWRTILRFNDLARAELAADRIFDESLGDWLTRHQFDETFLENYILPMGGAIWSTPEAEMLDYPARAFFRFFENHRLMHKERPKWRTVRGGSQNYVRKIADLLGSNLQLNSPVCALTTHQEQVCVHLSSGQKALFDEVILATHSDTSLELLRQKGDSRSALLADIRYRPNRIYLHRDTSFMPERRAAWASWNVLKQRGPDICLTYWMNRLQNIPSKYPVFVTLNPDTPPDEALVFNRFEKAHPQFDGPAQTAVDALEHYQGQDHIWLAGAWMGSGFHEDGLKSGLKCALALGGQVPWDTQALKAALRPPLSPQMPAEPAGI